MESTNKNVAIYTTICEIVADPEFNEGQMNFFNKNCSAFSADEENKHEYKEIHEEYIKLLEIAIEVQIKEKFTEEEMEIFYLDFKENFNNYKAINEDAFSIMIASVDFQQFKEQMLKSKVIEEDKSESKTQDYGKIGSNKYFDLASEDYKDPKKKWTKVVSLNKEKDGYSATVHRRPLEGNFKGCNMIRADLKYKNAKVDWYM